MTDWKGIVGTVAPLLAGAFGGPLAGAAAAVAGKYLLGKDMATAAEVQEFVLANQDPETLARLKAAEQQFAVEMRKLDIDLARVSADDRASARNREIQTGSHAPAVLATVVVLGFFALLGALVTGAAAIPPDYQPLVFGLVGSLAAALTQVLNYYFGSTSGSARKNALIADLGAASRTGASKP